MTFQQRTISLLTNTQRDTALAAIQNIPVGQNIEIVIREIKKQRSIDQNALMWSGPLKDMAEQVWANNRQYSAEIWHEYLKDAYLPEVNEPYIFELVKNPDSYKKYDTDHRGVRRLIGSTTDLSKYGMTQYLEQIYAYGASMGVLFTTKER